MDGHEEHHALSDEALAKELEAALKVEPSPRFVAQLRARIEDERDRSFLAASPPWRWAAVIVAAAVIAIAVLSVTRREPPATPAPRAATASPVPAAETASPPAAPLPERPPAVARAARENTPRRAVVPATPEVLISQDEADALRRLFAALNQRRFETLPDLEAALRPPTPITAIEIEPITVRALDSE